MSEADTPKDEIMFQEFVDFLHDVEATQPCTACGRKGWVVLTGDTNSMVKIDLSSDDGRGITIYSAYCSNCGMVRSHASPVIIEWRKERADREANRIDEPAGDPDEQV